MKPKWSKISPLAGLKRMFSANNFNEFGKTVAKFAIVAVMTRTASTSGYELGLLAAAGVLTIIPGAIVIWFVRNYIAKGFALGRV